MEDALIRWLQATAHLRADVAAVVGTALALGVTVHALLRKRRVSVAVGWIGLAWLSPVFGTALYLLFGINRVERRARKFQSKPSAAPGAPNTEDAIVPEVMWPLDKAVRRITGLPALAGNTLRLFRNGDAAYPVMLGAIDRARSSIALSSYIFRDDPTGRTFCAALKAAQDRGVAVRVIIDGIGGGYFRAAAFRRLRASGVPAALFMHSGLPWRMPFLNLRTHKKLLILDGREAFTGGLNISQPNRLRTRPDHPIRDTHFHVAGPVVEQLMLAFSADWAFADGGVLEGPDWFPDLQPVGDSIARVVLSGPDADVEKIEFVILQALACARSSVRFVTPYFLPDEVVMNALILASQRGITVDIVIPRVSDHHFIDWATRAHVAPLIRNGVRIWLDEPPFDHSKAMVVDGAWCFVGSANWDMRSFRLNFELNVEIHDAALAAQLETFIRAKMETPLTMEAIDARALPVRLRDAGVRLLLPYL
ncbi:Major cardiolipin synthase ClsA [Methylobacterium cerastii]|uniref:Phospholipase D n=1 Tax=Methylobacterium cerastii TaxID=932741 RepID=A0ABQ4QNX5_9HYPH|nr:MULTISPECIES: phospholipase D-like domain-containing protein [Methylobacterium]TXM68162.1 cardiolipin synthase [Methylobacterium sp. WL12]TXM96937.1 cardiolipin synthase [Methylobacterium sp. WL103]GJD46749.1 Major cardiolipin synthase ClsA [Methylobacterium cerastii]